MARWVHYSSLRAEARRAFDKGDGKHGKYAVDGNQIAALDGAGRPKDWILVVRGGGEPIVEIPAEPANYETRVSALEAEGLTRSDAQAVVDAEIRQTREG